VVVRSITESKVDIQAVVRIVDTLGSHPRLR
jgi:hypothetical protein